MSILFLCLLTSLSMNSFPLAAERSLLCIVQCQAEYKSSSAMSLSVRSPLSPSSHLHVIEEFKLRLSFCLADGDDHSSLLRGIPPFVSRCLLRLTHSNRPNIVCSVAPLSGQRSA
jgi:hypothetical protein